MYQKTTLDNELRILTAEMPHIRSVTVGFFLGVGSRYEPDELGGISHFIEHMLFKGTEKRPTAKEIAVAIEGIGGVFNASTGREMTTYWAKVAQPHLPIALDVLVDMLRHARFDPQEVEKERRVIIEEINMTRDTPDEWVFSLANRLLWPGHPLGRDVAGTRESVGGVGRKDLLATLRRYYHPRNAVVAVAGNIQHEEVVDRIAEYLGDWEPGEISSYLPLEDEQREPRAFVEGRDTEQAHLCLNVPGVSYTHPDRFTFQMLSAVLGQGMSSRLFLEIRERQGLAYSVHSYHSHFQDTGVMGVYAGVDPRRIEKAVTAILAELDRLRQEPVEEEELTKTKEFAKGRLMLHMENTHAVAAWLGSQELLTGEVLTVDEVVERIDAITAEELQRVAQELFRPDRLNLAVIGPFEEGEDRFQALLNL
ncbi:MAG TPA: insulinase family protein [Anaerolineae bacterium]|nr:insulinase family protein [Anaerolineae bacterium]